jgi:glutamyl-Q tRNA(Asp) synthetase
VRIEDIDGARSRPELADQFRADLAWLGLSWREVAPQSQRIASYLAAAQVLHGEGLLYPCRCTRAQIAAGAHGMGPDGPVYPGTCRPSFPYRGAFAPAPDVAWRLDMARAMEWALARHGSLAWEDERRGCNRPIRCRSGMSCSGARMRLRPIIWPPRSTMPPMA